MLDERYVAANEWKTRVTKVQPVKTTPEVGEACLVLIYPPGPDMGRRFVLGRDEITLGRGPDCDIQVDRDSVSRRHARVFRVNEQWMGEDLGSTNGSYVNDTPITRAVLRDGDFLKIGSVIFKFLTGVGVEAAYHEEIYRMTIIDALTGAYNKRYFVEFLEREAARCSRYRRPLSVIMCDIDNFKQVNDRFGHLTGDYVIKETSRRLLGRVRREELLARYGGEEFVAVLPETDHQGALIFGEQVRRLIADEAFDYEGEHFSVSISVGVATATSQAIDIQALVGEADENLLHAKRTGKNRVIG